MTAFLMYIGKVAVLLAVFYLFYRLLMERETFHRLNRAVMLLSRDHGGRSLIVCRKDQRPVPPFGQKNDDLFCKDERERMYQAAPESALFLILFFPFMWFFA